VIGHTLQGREIIALKVTQGAGIPDGTRPAVLYNADQHAREWISVEVNRRLLHYILDNYGTDADVTDLVNNRELWFVLVANQTATSTPSTWNGYGAKTCATTMAMGRSRTPTASI